MKNRVWLVEHSEGQEDSLVDSLPPRSGLPPTGSGLLPIGSSLPPTGSGLPREAVSGMDLCAGEIR